MRTQTDPPDLPGVAFVQITLRQLLRPFLILGGLMVVVALAVVVLLPLVANPADSLALQSLCNIEEATSFVVVENTGSIHLTLEGWSIEDEHGSFPLPPQRLAPSQIAFIWSGAAQPADLAAYFPWISPRDPAMVQEIVVSRSQQHWTWRGGDGVRLRLADGTNITPAWRHLTCCFFP